MGIFKKAAVATGKAAVKGAYKKAKKATRHYCPVNDGRHQFVLWKTETGEFTGQEHGPGIHKIFHCKQCGFVR